MKGRLFNKYYACVYLSMVVAMLGIWHAYVSVAAISHISFSVDSRISDATKKNIEQLIYTAYAQSQPNAKVLSALIKQQFPCLKSVSVLYEPPNMVNITCKTRKPYCLLNYDFVLTAEAIPVHKKSFKPNELEHLHRIMLNAQLLNNQDVLNACKQCVASLPPIVFETYQVTWLNSIELQLLDEKNNFSVIVDMHNPPDSALLSQCNAIKDELQQKGVLQSNRNGWIADIRFSNQIIVSKGTRGSNYG